MIQSTKQQWQIGATVRVGFLHLVVKGTRPDTTGKPDIYDLESPDGKRRYEFIPHNGLHKIT